ncbi:hypothetical protein OG349_23335 [Streptomyces sp. NBC_01317]|nr:hypothetical protein OG349_23335 [Streptomyces sp. NBC_01317]
MPPLRGRATGPSLSGADHTARALWFEPTPPSPLFGFFNGRRLVPIIPAGMHQFVNTVACFQLGDFTSASGAVVHDDLTKAWRTTR